MPSYVIRRHLTPFHKNPQIKLGLAPRMLVHVLTKFGSDWAIFYLFMTSNVHFCFTTFFADQSWASSSFVASDNQSSKCYYFWTTHSFHINDLSLERYDVAVCSLTGFFRCLYQTIMCLWANHLCIGNMSTYR